jgi:hypothetical protein
VTDVERGEHPGELGPAEAAVRLVEKKIVLVVPLDEPVLERGEEYQEGQDGDDRGYRQRLQPAGGFARELRGRADAETGGGRAVPAAPGVAWTRPRDLSVSRGARSLSE